jgi:FlaA1/EpsC-like NDP-sugar epimerase
MMKLDKQQLKGFIKDKRILITGAAGSIGSELVRQLCLFNPESITFFDRNETAVFYLEKELNKEFPNVKIIPRLGSICDEQRAAVIFSECMPHIVYHVAANKHVPLSEENPSEAIYNNIYGTSVILNASILHNVEVFTFVSTDKAVNPSSIMGMTKRVAEILIQCMYNFTKTKCITVRFGNVFGSSGSVVQIFKSQLQKDKSLTITHPDMERYFISAQDATKLLIQSSMFGKTGDLFMLDMGNPIKIKDLAKDIIISEGYNLDEISIKYTGIRPGEKLQEDLMLDSEISEDTEVPQIKKIINDKSYSNKTLDSINYLIDLSKDKTAHDLKNELKRII